MDIDRFNETVVSVTSVLDYIYYRNLENGTKEVNVSIHPQKGKAYRYGFSYTTSLEIWLSTMIMDNAISPEEATYLRLRWA